jgi:two-component system response regulator RegA
MKPTSDSQSMSILIVDDDQLFRERLARALNTRGFKAQTAADIQLALDLAKTQSFDAAIIDLHMPGGSGLSLIQPLRQLYPKIRLLVLTGYGSIANALQAVKMGADDYLTKPADADQVAAALLGQSKTQPEEAKRTPSLDWLEWEHIQRVLVETNHNISETARVLGIDRRSLQRKLVKHPPLR